MLDKAEELAHHTNTLHRNLYGETLGLEDDATLDSSQTRADCLQESIEWCGRQASAHGKMMRSVMEHPPRMEAHLCGRG